MIVNLYGNVKICEDMACIIIHETGYAIRQSIENNAFKYQAKNLFLYRKRNEGISLVTLKNMELTEC